MWAIARLRCAEESSEAQTSSSTCSGRPARREKKSSTRWTRCSGAASSATISEWVVIAPTLIIGFLGRFVPSSRESSLKASPEASTPTEAITRSSPRSSRARA